MNIKIIKTMILAFSCFISFVLLQSKAKVLNMQAPIFQAKAAFPPDGQEKDFDLKNYIGQNIVLYFYPFDNNFICTEQAKIFTENIEKLKSLYSIQVIGVSCDSPFSHKRFLKKHNITYPLVSDGRISRNISMKYGTVGFFHSKRKTFLIDKKGIVFKVFDEVDINSQIDDILKAFNKKY